MTSTSPPAGLAKRPATPEFRAKYGPWAIVTGASDGIGRACAIALAGAGLSLVLVARREEVLRPLAVELRASGVEVLVCAGDVGDARFVDEIAASTASLDVGLAVLAAGFGSLGPFVDSDLETETDMVETNVAAVMRLTHHVVQRLSDRRRGGLVLFGSIVVGQGTPMQANYAATKAYIRSFGEALRVELSPLGVDVLVVSPGGHGLCGPRRYAPHWRRECCHGRRGCAEEPRAPGRGGPRPAGQGAHCCTQDTAASPPPAAHAPRHADHAAGLARRPASGVRLTFGTATQLPWNATTPLPHPSVAPSRAASLLVTSISSLPSLQRLRRDRVECHPTPRVALGVRRGRAEPGDSRRGRRRSAEAQPANGPDRGTARRTPGRRRGRLLGVT